MKTSQLFALFLLLCALLCTGCPQGGTALSVCDRMDDILLAIHAHHLTAPPETRFLRFSKALMRFRESIGATPVFDFIPANREEIADQCKKSLRTLQQQSPDTNSVDSPDSPDFNDAILMILDHYTRGLDPHSRVDDISELSEAAKLTALPRMLGIRLDLTQNPPLISEVLPGSPAHLAGIEEGSKLLQVNGRDVANATPQTLADLKETLSKNRSALRLFLEKPDGVKREYSVEQGYFDTPAVEFESIPAAEGFIGSIKLRRFDQDSDRVSFAVALQGLARSSAMILDLRGNRGGVVQAAAEIANHFVAGGGAFAAFADARGNRIKTFFYAHKNSTWDGPLVVIIDRDTHSAAELLAAALQDNGALVVGERSSGEGTSQEAVSLKPFGLMGAAYVTDAFDYRPSGAPTQIDGVTPDIPVSLSDSLSKNVPREGELKNSYARPQASAALEGFDPELLAVRSAGFRKRLHDYLKRAQPWQYSKDTATDLAARMGFFLCIEAGRCRGR